MNLHKYKWLFYVFTFLLMSIVALVVKEITPGRTVPAVTEGIIIVIIFYCICFLGYKLIINIIKLVRGGNDSHKKHNNAITNKRIISFALIALLTISVLINLLLIKNNNLSSNIDKTENIKSDSLENNFDKKVSCTKYFQQIKSDLVQKRDAYFKSESTSAISRLVGYEDYILGFYSPKLATCIYVVNHVVGGTDEDRRKAYIDRGEEDSFILYDALTNNKVKTFPESQAGDYAKFLEEYSGGEVKI